MKTTHYKTANNIKTPTEHTPGPWSVEECHNIDGSKFLTINGQGPHGAWLADIQAGSVNGHPADVNEKHLANAYLIAAAPGLLAHLKMLVLGISEGINVPKDGAAITAAREAIAKAEGKA